MNSGPKASRRFWTCRPANSHQLKMNRELHPFSSFGMINFARISYTQYPFFDKLITINNKIWNTRYGKGTSVLDYDWDNLIILDACRYDEFLQVAPFSDGRIDYRVTLASRTAEFLNRSFKNCRLHDTVYVTANPVVISYENKKEAAQPTFHSIVSLLDNWEPEIQTIHPKTVTQAAINAEKEFPHKKLIVHYLQPHAPFIGEKAAELRERTGKTVCGLDPELEFTDREVKNIDTLSYYEAINRGSVSPEEIKTAYRQSLEIALEHVMNLLSELGGKTAITADHGELLHDSLFPFGQHHWEHPKDIRKSELCKVPWVEIETGFRKKIKAHDPQEQGGIDDEMLNSQLEALGYK